MFFQFFLPSTVGGDIARAELASARIGSRTTAYTAVLFDRFIGFAAVLGVSAISMGFAFVVFGWFNRTVSLIWASFVLAAGIFVLSVVNPWLGRALQRLASKASIDLEQSLARANAALRAYMLNSATFITVYLLGIATHVVGLVATMALLASALGIQIPFLHHLIAVPLITLITLLPVAINGIGLREVAYVLLYANEAVTAPAAISLSFAWTLVLVFFSLIGGVCLMLPSVGGARCNRGR